MLQAIGDALWIADGPVVRFLRFFPYPTRMVVVRLEGGGLFVGSPIALDLALAREVESLGAVRELRWPS